jgi:HAD superfamily hydrolase (TIGR01509 family)
MTEAVLFDFNGVLVDDEAQHCRAMQEILRDVGIELSRDDYYAIYLGFDDRTGFVEAFRRAHRTLTTDVLQRLVETKSLRYQELMESSLQLVAGAADFVRAAAKCFRLAVVTGALRREIELVLGRTPFATCFEAVITADDVRTSKPNPEGYLAAHAALERRRSIPRAGCVVFEDSLPGLAAARAAGMPCIMLATNHSAAKLQAHGAPVVWDSFDGHTPAELARP